MALLYWEGIRRIVPVGYELYDPPDTMPAVAQKLVQSVSPDPYLQRAAARFRNAFASDRKLGKRLSKLKNLSKTFDMHPGKIDPQLLEELRDAGLALKPHDDPDYQLPREVGVAYMLALAAEIAEEE